MKIQIRQSRGSLASAALRTHVENRLGLALGRFAGEIGPVTVSFSERDGRQRCLIAVGLRPRRIRAEDSNRDPFAAVNHAIELISGSVGRTLERERRWEEDRVVPVVR